jgi:hypothetical protein
MTKSAIENIKFGVQLFIVFAIGLSFIALSSLIEREMMVDGCRAGVIEACANTGGCIIKLNK